MYQQSATEQLSVDRMDNCTNTSNCTGNGMVRGDFEAFGFLIFFMGGLSLSLNIPTIIALCTTRSVAIGRMYLISILVTGIVLSISGILTGLIVLVTVFSGVQPPPLLLCRFLIWVYNICQSARSFSVAGFSIVVLLVVRYGKKNIKVMYIILSLCISWGIPLLLTIQYQVPQVYAVKFVAGSVCLPVQDETIIIEARLFFTVFVLTIETLVPLVVCIAVSLIVFRYLKKHSITGDINCSKTVVKLGLFLLTGNLVNSTGSIVISILAYFTTGSGAALIYCAYAIGMLSLYPTPILILAFLKPVRDKLKMFLKSRCLCGHPSIAGESRKSTSAANTSV